jgi:MFS family permease
MNRWMTASTSGGPRLGRDFWIFFGGQTVSNLGSSVTLFALPLLVFKLTGSALDLGMATAATFLPYLLFGLLIGAWVDRLDRRRLMIAADLAQAGTLATIPVLSALGLLSIQAVYGVAFVSSTLKIAFDAGQFAAIPSLVSSDDLVSANGRIQASFSAATIAGPPLAGLLVSQVPVEGIFLADAVSFLVSAGTLALVRRSFNAPRDGAESRRQGGAILRDVTEGLRYVWSHPVLRAISIMMALVNFVGTTVFAQLVLFAKEELAASDPEVGLLFAAGSVGTVVFSLAAGALRRRFSFGVVALGALAMNGLLVLTLGLSVALWQAMVLQGIIPGLGSIFNINTASLRQSIVPNYLLGRVMSVAGVLAFSAIPLGTLLGGWLIEATGNIRLVYALIGISNALIAAGFFVLSPLGRAERYLPPAETGAATAK